LFYSLLLTMVAVPASGVLGIEPPLSLNYSWLPSAYCGDPAGNKKRPARSFVHFDDFMAARLATIWLDDSALFGITLGMWTIVGYAQRPALCDLRCTPGWSIPSIYMRR